MKQISVLLALSILLITSSCSVQKKQVKLNGPVRGTWVTNVASNALTSKEKVAQTVKRCKEYGLNTIYVCTWNEGLTMYPSAVVEKYIGIKQDPVYKGFDPIKEIIEQGHKEGLRVIAWFEFGFSYDIGDTTESIWLAKYPNWAGKNSKGELLKKAKFYWWNAIDPAPQQFITEMLLEFVKKYDADGIQGDDRLPAMPSEGGYEDYTKALYAKEHNGAAPPTNFKDPAWLQWRCDKLSTYAKSLYGNIKSIKPNYVVSWSPGNFPYSKLEYLQDWPAWLKGGYADEILPQLYRNDVVPFEKILKELDSQVTAEQKLKLFPGLLTSLGDGYLIKPYKLSEMIKLLRQYGFMGESTFYFEGLNKLKPYYPAEEIKK